GCMRPTVLTKQNRLGGQKPPNLSGGSSHNKWMDFLPLLSYFLIKPKSIITVNTVFLDISTVQGFSRIWKFLPKVF
ncbi:MAG: hypothetical protein ACFFCD_00090, partial [Promethearchaeota archaeon]